MYQSTPLHRAARGNQAGVIAPLVGSGANVNTPNEVGRTALHVAAAHGHVETVQKLIELGADLNYRDHRGESPMHRPVFFQHVSMISFLIEHGASVTSEDGEGNTPLHVAASMNRDIAAHVLLDAGADVEATNNEGLTPLDLAIINQHGDNMEHNAEVAEVLLRYGATIVPERIPVSDRHALWPHLTPAELLLETGDIDYAKLPELSESVRRQLPESDDLGNSTISKVMTRDSLLHDAAKKSMAGLVETLLRSGVSVMTAIRMHGTPLHAVARYGTCEMAALLLDWGADLDMPYSNATDSRYDPYNEGRSLWTRMGTPLDVAQHYENPRQDMARFLLDRGAEPLPDDE